MVVVLPSKLKRPCVVSSEQLGEDTDDLEYDANFDAPPPVPTKGTNDELQGKPPVPLHAMFADVLVAL
jgi:hypothetical protein